MTNALAIRNEITPSQWEMITAVAPAAHRARLFKGIASPETAMMIMLKGHELGLSLTASFELIQMIENQPPSVSPRGALALIHGSPECAGVKITRLVGEKGEFVGYECWMKRRNGFEHTVRFTLADAKRAYLTEGSPTSTGKRGYGNWEKYPENMCLWRVVGFCADVVFPDVLGGMKTADQYGAVINEAGDVIPGQWTDAQPDAEYDETADAAIAAQALVEEYGAEAVLAANGGNIPATLEEVDAVRYTLIAAEPEAVAQ